MTLRKLSAAVCLFLCPCAAYLAAQGNTGSRRFTLSGTVVDGSNRPLGGVEVVLSAEGTDPKVDPVVSDAQGRFAFRGLAAGDYTIFADDPRFGVVPYGELPGGLGGAIRVGGESGDKSVVFQLVARGSIDGVVRDEFGDPMPVMLVSIERPVWRSGRAALVFAGQKGTDDRGRYHFGNIAPGNYMVCVGGGHGAPVPMPGPVDYAARVENRYYARTCNHLFALAPGQRAQVDLIPVAGTAATVRGKVRNLPAQTGFSVNLLPQDDGQRLGQVPNAFVDASQGTFTIRGVQPGHYILHAQAFSGGGRQNTTADMPLDVGGSDIDGLEIELGSEATVDVAVHGLAADENRSARVMLRSAGGGDTPGNYGQLMDGGFHLQGFPPGDYRLVVHSPAESCVASIKLGDSEIRGRSFHIGTGAALHLDVTLTQTCGGVRVRAVRDGAAVPGAKIVLLTEGTPADPAGLEEQFADDEGGCTFTGLTPGKYLVWAWAVEGSGAMSGPSSLEAASGQATAVEVTAGDTGKADVAVLKAEGSGQ